ncbi:MAG: hypothetical protein WA001_01075 [Patescibacteria group bacterium]
MPKSPNPYGEDKKRVAPKKRSTVRRAPAAARAKPLKKVVVPIVSRGPSLLLSPDEKRGMIMAHASMRGSRDPVQMATLWAGVAAAFIVIVGAWAWAFGPSLLQAAGHPLNSGLVETEQGAEQIKQQVDAYAQTSELKQELDQASAQLDSFSTQAAVEQQTVDSIAASVNASSSANGSRDVFQPAPKAPVTKPVTP